MKTHQKVTYTLPKNIILDIDIIKLMSFGEGIRISKSALVKVSLLKSFKLFEEEVIESVVEKH